MINIAWYCIPNYFAHFRILWVNANRPIIMSASLGLVNFIVAQQNISGIVSIYKAHFFLALSKIVHILSRVIPNAQDKPI